MDAIKAILEFLGSYPLWAKALILSCFSVIAATLIFSPHRSAEKDNKTTDSKNQMTYLCIRGVSLHPGQENVMVQVLAIVNGTTFQYPSIGGVDWLAVGPTMPPQCFMLPPDVASFQTRFEMKIKHGQYDPERLASQEEFFLSRAPIEKNYPLYLVHERIHSDGTSATVRFGIEVK